MESLNRLFWCGVLVAALAACGRVDEPALVTSVEKKLAEGRADAAAFEVKAFLQQAPESARARHLLGRALLAMGDAAGAETELRRATSLNSADESLRADLARALNLQQRYDQASELATEQALTAAKTPALGLAAAAAWLELGDHASAEQLLGQLRRQFPGDSDVQVAEINLIAAMRGAAQALPLAADLVKKHPEHAGAWKLQGDVFTATGKGDPTPAYERAVAINDASVPAALRTLGDIYLRRREYARAEVHMRRVMELRPDSRSARSALIRLYDTMLQDPRYRDDAEIRQRRTDIAGPGAASPAYRVQGESSIGVTGPGVNVPSPAPIATNTDGASSPITRSGRPSPVTSATAIATT